MHSKDRPWDFEKKHETIIDPAHPGLYLFYSYDPYLEVYFNLKMKSLFSSQKIDGKLKVVTADEITQDWIDENLSSVGLFFSDDSFLILTAEKLEKNVFQYLVKNTTTINQRFIILNFSKESSYLEDSTKSNCGRVLMIDRPKFWETEKLFDYVCKILKIHLTPEIRKYLLESLPAETSHYIAKLSLLKKIYPDLKLAKLEEIKGLITYENTDFFSLVSLYSRKDFKNFGAKLLLNNLTSEELASFIVFMIKHLTKLLDVEPIIKKNEGKKMNDYNKEIIACSKLWSKQELLNSIRKFTNWQKTQRKSPAELISFVREEFLQQFVD